MGDEEAESTWTVYIPSACICEWVPAPVVWGVGFEMTRRVEHCIIHGERAEEPDDD